MTKVQAIALQQEWNQRAERARCQHPKQEIERGANGMLTST
jgi:hypothetical protein